MSMRLVAVFGQARWGVLVAAGVIGGLCMVGLVPAGAAAATIGSDLKGSPNPGSGYSCGKGFSSCALQQIELPGNVKTKAPFTGVIRKWRFRTVVDPEAAGWKLRLRVVRETGPGQYTFVRKSKPGVVKEPGRHRFKTKLRIRKGDFIALQLPGKGNPNIQGFYAPSAGADAVSWFPAPPNGDGGSPSDTEPGIDYFYNATIKHRR